MTACIKQGSRKKLFLLKPSRPRRACGFSISGFSESARFHIRYLRGNVALSDCSSTLAEFLYNKTKWSLMKQYLLYLSCLYSRLIAALFRSLFTCLPNSIKDPIEPRVMKRILEFDFPFLLLQRRLELVYCVNNSSYGMLVC